MTMKLASVYTSLDADPDVKAPKDITMRDIHPGSAFISGSFAGFSLDPATGVLGPRTRDLNSTSSMPPRQMDVTLMSADNQGPLAPGRVLPGAYADLHDAPVWISSYDKMPPKDLGDFRGGGAPVIQPLAARPVNPFNAAPLVAASNTVRTVASPAMASAGFGRHDPEAVSDKPEPVMAPEYLMPNRWI